MNLCICSDLPLDGNSGAVSRIMELAKHVSNQGITVFLINRTVKNSLTSLLVDSDKYFRIKNGVIEEYQYPKNISFLFPGVIKLFQEIINRLISKLTFSDLSEISFSHLIDPHLFVKLIYVGIKEKIELIQCEFPITTFSSFLAKKILNIPLIYDSHNIEAERMSRIPSMSSVYVAITKIIEKTGCKISDSIFTVSERDKNVLIDWGFSQQKIHVVSNSVEVKKYSTTRRDEIRKQLKINDKIALIFHGPLSYIPNKEAANIILEKIMPSIWQKYPDTYLLLVGSNPPKTTQPNVIATGFVKNLIDYIGSADIAIVPLLSGGGTRIKIIEYLASGKPIVSTFQGAEGLTLEHGQDVLLTKNPDSKFIDLIYKLISDVDLRKSLGKNARKKAELLYDWKNTAANAILIYEKLINERENLNLKSKDFL